ncbi:MAG: glutamate-ammonia-ligase adenylyltransferase [Lentisphaerae bacterium]|nr:glutamate-ammonia-ligase adenylyltransferase [Lentisphaerota bacterium]
MKPTLEQLRKACPDLPASVIEDHLERLDDAYFQVFNDLQIRSHLDGLARLSSANPVEVLVEPSADGLTCTIIAFDYPFEFSLITGVLSGLGLNILSGEVFTYRPAVAEPAKAPVRRKPRPVSENDILRRRRKIIDRFSGPLDSELSPEDWAREFRRRLTEVILLLENGGESSVHAAKHKANESVARRLTGLQQEAHPVLYPVDIRIDHQGPRTRLRVVSQDTPAFLYAMSSALSLQQMSIERVRIQTREGRIEDDIEVLDAKGLKIEDPERLDRLKLSVLFTKQFTYFLPHAPDPYSALCRYEELVNDILSLPDRGRWTDLLSNPAAMQNLAKVLGASDFLWEDFIRLQYETLLPILKPRMEARPPPSPGELAERLRRELDGAASMEKQREILNAFKDREIFLIDMDHILNPAGDVRAMAERLTRLAELAILESFRLSREHLVRRFGVPRTVAGLEARTAVFGLGKLGGEALGYASDLEVLFVYSDSGRTDGAEPLDNAEFFELLVRSAADFIQAKREGIFHVDLRLRPFGKGGPLACSLENFCRYYGPGGPAHAYEQLALARLRALGGDHELGAQVERLRDQFVYEGKGIHIGDLRELREKQLAEKTVPGRINAKFSPGALVDLEYDVQILQVVHGREHPELRTPRIHKALQALSELGVLGREESLRLANAYVFLRRLINGLRMLRGSALDLFLPPAGAEEFAHLARRMGYSRMGELEPEQQLRLEFEAHTAGVRAFIEKHFGRDSLPGPADGNVADLILSEAPLAQASRQILAHAGFQDPARAFTNLRNLAGADERQDLFARLAVLACDTLRRAPDADMALNNWERFVQILPDAAGHFQTMLSQPRRLEILLQIFSASQFLADTLIRNPEFLEWIAEARHLHQTRATDVILNDMRAFAGAAPADADPLDAMRRFRRREILRIGARDICLHAPIRQIAADLSSLAEASILFALDHARDNRPARFPWLADIGPSGPLCILAFGKLGGAELNYSSDLDLVGLYDPSLGTAPPDDAHQAEGFSHIMKSVGHALSAHTVEGSAYRVDFRLRPYGREGQLAVPFAALVDYYRTRAAPWEIQALLKLRPVAGNIQLGLRFLETVKPVFLRQPPAADVAASIRHMRQLAAKTAHAHGEAVIDVKNGVGGIRDIEFLSQGLQLIHAHARPDVLTGNTLDALERLQRSGLLPDLQANELADDYGFLRRVEHFLQLFEDRQVHAVPESPDERRALARRVLGPESTAEQFIEELTTRLRRIHAAYTQALPGVEK